MKTQRGRFFIWVTLLIVVTVFGTIISTACTNNTDDDASAETEQEMWSTVWTSSDSGKPLVDLELRIYADGAVGYVTAKVTKNAKLYFYLIDEGLSNTTSKLYLTITITGQISKTINYTSTMYIKDDNLNHEEQILDMTDYEDGRYKFNITGYTQTDKGKNKHDMNDKEINLVIDKTVPTLKSTVANGAYTNEAFIVEKDREDNLYRIFVKRSDSKNAPVALSKYETFSSNSSISIPATDTDGWYSFLGLDDLWHVSEVYWVCLDTIAPTLKSTVSNGAYTNKQFTVEKNTEENWDRIYVKYNGDSKTAPVTTTDYDSMHTDTSITITATASNGWYSFIAVDKAGNQSEVYWVFLDTTPT